MIDGVVVKFKKLVSFAQLPEYAHGPEDAGMDLFAVYDGALFVGERLLVTTGLAIELPPGFEAQVRSRSGLAVKFGVHVLNAPGTVDPGYRGELKVLLKNSGDKPWQFKAGERIAQLVIAPTVFAEIREEDALSDTKRGAGGFGSTGA